MPKIQFETFNFRPATIKKIEIANTIIELYRRQGYRLTLRQLFYQMVARGLIPNTKRSYKNLGSRVGKGRLAGLIDWNSIEDRLRHLVMVSHWNEPRDIVKSAARSFRIDKWENQPNRIEIWVEKDAVSNILEPVARRHDVGFFAARGYPSLSEMYSAGSRFAAYMNAGQEVHILHLGDHDPSGIDMTRDIRDRIEMFAETLINVDRLALNWNQIERYDPPPNFAKETDSRYNDYVDQYGFDSWELDALEPATLESIVEPAILALRDDQQWEIDIARENEFRRQLDDISREWENVVWFIDDLNGNHVDDDE